jgi:tRNA(Ile)-lysidine synthase
VVGESRSRIKSKKISNFVLTIPMEQAFKEFIKQHQLFNKKSNLLLAISGGIDSVCLFHLLLNGGYQFSVAHCNYNLRGDESNKDEAFVKKLAQKHQIPFYTKSFKTQEKMEEFQMGVQETARKLRYDWFKQLIKKHRFDNLLTAHHLSDNTETFFINIVRHTGISGLHGIPVKNKHIVRPLMFATRDLIEQYIKQNYYKHREDASNAKDDYLRNKIRHHLSPQLEKHLPNFHEHLMTVCTHVKDYEDLSLEIMQHLWQQITQHKKDVLSVNIKALNSIKNAPSLMYFMTRQYGFNKVQILDLWRNDTETIGKKIVSDKYEIIREREHFLILEIKTIEAVFEKIKKLKKTKVTETTVCDFTIIEPHLCDFKQANLLHVDFDKITLPLTIQTWQDGDKMKPLGMKGQKNISDILTDKKVNNAQRKTFNVLKNADGKIIALYPFCVSEDYKVDSKSKLVLAMIKK